MDLLWSKDRLHKILSTESIMVHANGTGDCGTTLLSCYLCGDESNLRRFDGTYLFNGVEEKYDKMLYESFGIEVKREDNMICKNCIQQLRNAYQFRNLINAAFVAGPLSNSLESKPEHCQSKPHISISYIKRPQSIKLPKSKMAIDNLQKRCELRRDRKRLSNMHTHMQAVPKKANVACTVCNQRYPMMVPFDGIKKFVCSRCKKNAETYVNCKKCNMRLPTSAMQEHMKTHSRFKSKGKSRLYTGPKALPTSQSKSENLSRTQTYVKYHKKYQCSNCDKKYFVPQHLAHHISTVHGDILDCTCAVCGKDMKTREKLDHHMRSHTGQPTYQCSICLKIFQSQRNLQAHYLAHQKIR